MSVPPTAMSLPPPVEPQTFGVTAPQNSGSVQVPHAIVPPQPSEMVPQLAPCSLQVFGVQQPLVQVPPQPSDCPHSLPLQSGVQLHIVPTHDAPHGSVEQPAPQSIGSHPEPAQQTKPQPSGAPQALPSQLGTQSHTPFGGWMQVAPQ